VLTILPLPIVNTYRGWTVCVPSTGASFTLKET
jgi:hypothetical protein